MRIWILTVAMCCVLAPTVVNAQADVDCHSAKRPPVPMKEFLQICGARATAARAASGRATALLAAAPMVQDSRTTVAGLNFSNVPTWSNADILAQFPLTRDKAYLTATSSGSLKRRIPWLYPDDGCFARAEQVNALAAQAGKVKPYKLFAFGDPLRVFSENFFDGEMEWGYHTVPVVKNSAGEPIVFDAALSPCRPLPWKEWLSLLVGDLRKLDNLAEGWGVALGDANAYYPESLVSGEPSHAAESVSQMTEGFLSLLNMEWNRQIELNRNPSALLGSSPPWGNYACVSASETPLVSATVAPGVTQTLTATCPFATLATGGGFSAPQGFLVTRNAKSSGNGWTITARNNTSANAELDVQAMCLTGAPASASVTTITGSTTNVPASASGSSSASCATGTLIGGGYSTSGTTAIMRVYGNKRSTSTGSTWQVSAQNTTTSSKSITAYAYCLANTRFTFSQVAGGGAAKDTYSQATCTPKKALSGGYVFPKAASYHVSFQANFGPEIYLTTMAGTPVSPDPNAVGYAECLAHP